MGKVVADGGRIEVRELAESQNRAGKTESSGPQGPGKPRSSKSQRRISIALLLLVDVLMFSVGVFAARWASHTAFGLPSGQFFGGSWYAISEILIAYMAVYW